MNPPARLKRLELDAYRGAADRIAIPLDAPLNVIYGPNGSGKSTLATAIEWALFPVQASLLGESGIEERRSWEVANVHAGRPPEVALWLDCGGGEIVVRQKGIRGSGRPPLPVCCAYADFKHLVFIHQETIRGFLISPPAARQAALSRLLGAGWAQDVSTVMDRARKELRCKEADARVANLEALILAKMEEVRRLLAEERGRAREEGIEEPWASAARTRHQDIAARIEALCTGAGVAVPPPLSLEPLADYDTRLNRLLDGLRRGGPVGRETEIAARLARLRGALGAWTEAIAAWRRCRAELREEERLWGTPDDLRRRSEDTAQHLQHLRSSLAALDRKRAVMREAAAYLLGALPVPDCPVCGQPVSPELAEELERRLGASATAEETALRQELDRAETDARTLADAADRRLRLISRLDASAEHGRRVRRELEEALGRPTGRDEDQAAVASKAIEELQTELQRSQEAARTWLADLQQIEGRGRAMRILARIQALDTRLRALSSVRQSPEWADMTRALQALSVSEQTLRLAGERARMLAARLAERNLARVARPIGDYYARLTRRSDFRAVTIDPENKYEVAVGAPSHAWAPTAVLNLTDLNSLALAVVAGMAVAFGAATGLGFLILDDPSQGMDAEVTARFAALVDDLAGHTQVLVTTPDRRLLEELQRSARRKNVILLEPRDPAAAAPGIRVAMPAEGDPWTS